MTSVMKPTKRQFREYIRIRDSGETNMWDFKYILSISKTKLTNYNLMYIMNHFDELSKEYKIE